MAPLAHTDCKLKVNIHCDQCKRKMLDVLRSIRGVYSVSIDSREGIAKISGEVDPEVLMATVMMQSTTQHAELVNLNIRHPQLPVSRDFDQFDRHDDGDHYNYGSQYSSLSDSAYNYEQLRRRPPPVIEYPFFYSENYNPQHTLPAVGAIYGPSLHQGTFVQPWNSRGRAVSYKRRHRHQANRVCSIL